MKKRILVQAGHLDPREPGFESGTGTNGEQALVRAIRDKLATILRADGRFEALPMPGWIRPRGIKVDAALFLHADGSGNPTASGFSFGYPSYAVNKLLADLIGEEFQRLPGHPPHRADNYTRDLAGYYGFSRVDTPGPEVVVEHGFLTNPRERAWLTSHVDELARAEYKALLRYFKMAAKDQPSPPPPPPKPAKWSYLVVEELGVETTGKARNNATAALRMLRQLARNPQRIVYERLR